MSIELPIYDTLQSMAFALLSLAVVVNTAKEAIKLLQGQACDWMGLILRSVLSVCVLAAIPTIGRTLVSVVTSVGNYLLVQGETSLMDEAFAKAFASFDCPTGISITRSILSFLANAVLFTSMLLKLVVIDIGWTVAVHFVLYLGVLSIPASVFGGGGVGGYLKSLWSVSTWPILFALGVSAIGGFFGDTLRNVAEGHARIECGQIETLRDEMSSSSSGATSNSPTPGTPTSTAAGAAVAPGFGASIRSSSVWGVLRFVGVLAVLIVMLLSIPYLGMLAAGETSPGNMMGSMLGSAGGAKRGAKGAASGAATAASGVKGGVGVGVAAGAKALGAAREGISRLRR